MQKRIHPIKKYNRKYPQRPVLTTNNPEQCEAFYQATDNDAPLDVQQLATGILQHPISGMFQLWLSTNGLDVTCLSAHCREDRAKADMQALRDFVRCGDIYEEKKIEALLAQFKEGSDEIPRSFPDDLVRGIAREILRAVVDRRSGRFSDKIS
ncbi:MAG TPA: hypothetical protein VKR06_36885 [Ktedonosporobacter sp.]|nr:hypothetical protein [Ktedonosporobacter sp.]